MQRSPALRSAESSVSHHSADLLPAALLRTAVCAPCTPRAACRRDHRAHRRPPSPNDAPPAGGQRQEPSAISQGQEPGGIRGRTADSRQGRGMPHDGRMRQRAIGTGHRDGDADARRGRRDRPAAATSVVNRRVVAGIAPDAPSGVSHAVTYGGRCPRSAVRRESDGRQGTESDAPGNHRSRETRPCGHAFRRDTSPREPQAQPTGRGPMT